MNILSWSLRGSRYLVAFVRGSSYGWRAGTSLVVSTDRVDAPSETPLPPVETPTGLAATKLVAARRRAGMKERTRIVSEV